VEAGRGEVEKAKGGLPFARCVIFFKCSACVESVA